MTIEPVFSTRDMAVAAALNALGEELLRVEKSGNALIFVFDNKDVCEEYFYRYIKRNLPVDAQTYINSYNFMRDYKYANQ